jgi:probable HAF family extracellular repeat protein
MHEPIDRVTALAAAAVAAMVLAVAALPAAADVPPAGIGTTSHGFPSRGDVFTTIDHPDAATVPSTPDGQTGTGTAGINDYGHMVGVYEERNRVVHHFVRNRKGRFTIIAPGTRSDRLSYETLDINSRGEIVGFYNDDQGNTTTGFLRTRRGRFVDINIPGSQVTAPFRINDRRQVVGIYADAAGVPHGFLWDDGDYQTIDVPGAAATFVDGVDNHGQLVGSYGDAQGAYHGFVRNQDGAVTTLPDAPGAEPTAGGRCPSASTIAARSPAAPSTPRAARGSNVPWTDLRPRGRRWQAAGRSIDRRSLARIRAHGRERQASGSAAPRSDSGRGPKMRRSLSSMGTSLMLASRRRMYPSASNSHCSLP